MVYVYISDLYRAPAQLNGDGCLLQPATLAPAGLKHTRLSLILLYNLQTFLDQQFLEQQPLPQQQCGGWYCHY